MIIVAPLSSCIIVVLPSGRGTTGMIIFYFAKSSGILYFVDVFRGCYKEEFGVDPNLYGCHEQAGSTYCFCKGDKCNNKVRGLLNYRHIVVRVTKGS